jgi:hypothetical protein
MISTGDRDLDKISGTAFATLHFLCNLPMGPIS